MKPSPLQQLYDSSCREVRKLQSHVQSLQEERNVSLQGMQHLQSSYDSLQERYDSLQKSFAKAILCSLPPAS